MLRHGSQRALRFAWSPWPHGGEQLSWWTAAPHILRTSSWNCTASSQARRDYAKYGASELVQKLTLILMPQLSPNMTGGTVRKWLKQPGEEIQTYDVLFEVDTDTLTEDAYKVGDFAGTVTMLVEAQEDGILGDIFLPEGKEVAVHTPIAFMTESEDTLQEIRSVHKDIKTLVNGQKDALKALTWQSYLKESKEGRKGCS